MSLQNKIIYRLLGSEAHILKERRFRRWIDQMHANGVGLSPASYAVRVASEMGVLPA